MLQHLRAKDSVKRSGGFRDFADVTYNIEASIVKGCGMEAGLVGGGDVCAEVL
jgi:hypothetical protein